MLVAVVNVSNSDHAMNGNERIHVFGGLAGVLLRRLVEAV